MSEIKFLNLNLNSFRSRFVYGLAVMIALFSIFLTFLLYSLSKYSDKQTTQNEILVPLLLLNAKLKNDLNYSLVLADAYLRSGEIQFVREIEILNTNETFTELSKKIESLPSGEVQNHLAKIKLKLGVFYEKQQEFVTTIADQLQSKGYYKKNNYIEQNERYFESEIVEEESHDFEAASSKLNEIFLVEMLPKAREINNLFDLLRISVNSFTNEAQSENKANFSNLRNISLGLFFVISLTLSVFIALFIKAVERDFMKLRLALNELSKGNIPDQLSGLKNEFNFFARAINRIAREMVLLKTWAHKAGTGDYNLNLSVFDKRSEIGIALKQMNEKLGKINVDESQRAWINNGINKFSEIIRKNNDNLQVLADLVNRELVKITGSNQGGIFIKEESEEGELMVLKTCYAYDRAKLAQKDVFKGEGLLGQAWQEKDKLLITDVPQNYINIRSGLGKASPSCILIMPLMLADEVHGLIELASFRVYEKHEIAFIEALSESIASSVANVRSKEATLKLLKESQVMAEELKAQEEELRQNMEEMQATQEGMRIFQEELQIKQSNLNAVINNTDDTIFALDRDYKITIVNETLYNRYQKMGITLSVGKNIFDVLPEDKWMEWKERYDRALAGEKFVKMEERNTNGTITYIETHHNPIKSPAGEIIGVSVIAKDITSIKRNLMELERAKKKMERVQEEIKHNQHHMQVLLNNAEDEILTFDNNYQILSFNERAAHQFHKKGIALKTGTSIFQIHTKENENEWKDYYDRALNGEMLSFSKVITKNDKKTHLEFAINPMKDINGELNAVSVFCKNITRYKEAELKSEKLISKVKEEKNRIKQQEQEMLQNMEDLQGIQQELEKFHKTMSFIEDGPKTSNEAEATFKEKELVKIKSMFGELKKEKV